MMEFPKWLHHPGYTPAVLSEGAVGGPLLRGAHYAGVGKPEQFPPVIVHNRDDEAWYVSRGYAPGTFDPEQARRQREAPLPNGYREREYPRLEADGTITPDPDAVPPDTGEFPKWVEGEIAKNAEEEAEILARKGIEPEVPVETVEMTADDLAAFREWLRSGKPSPASAALMLKTLPPKQMSAPALRSAMDADPLPALQRTAMEIVQDAPRKAGKSAQRLGRVLAEQRELLALCSEAGLKADNRYSVKRLRAMLEAATDPHKEE